MLKKKGSGYVLKISLFFFKFLNISGYSLNLRFEFFIDSVVLRNIQVIIKIHLGSEVLDIKFRSL